MYIPNKFNYVAINRQTINGERRYATPDGEKLPSVTTILEATKPEEKKKALQEWRNRVGHKRAQEITTEAAGRGTRMHKWLENYIKTGITGDPGSNPYSKQSHAMAKHIISEGLKNVNEVWGVEVPLYFPGLYAGTTDGCGLHLNDESILDYKQTNKPKKEEWIDDYKIQLVAYILAHNEVYGTNIKRGVVFMCSRGDDPMKVGGETYQQFDLLPSDYNKYEDMWLKKVEEYYKLTA